jgi:uncharacterized protein (UPF0371 family)
MIDPFHLEAYGETTVNYNRDVEAFPLLRDILARITGTDPIYKSPTDMGVNQAGFGIIDDTAVQQAAREEILRRYFRYRCEYVMGLGDQEAVDRVEMLMKELDINISDRSTVLPSRAAARDAEANGKGHDHIYCGAALELRDGTLITGKNSAMMHAASSVVLNAIKWLAGIPDTIHLLSPNITESISALKEDILNARSASLDLEETLIALAISATTNPTAQTALEQLKLLKHCDMHMTHMPTPGDDAGLRRLGINLTTDPHFASKDLFVG